MPEPPLLLADRVLDIEGEPGTLGKGTIWTETDVSPDAWYLQEGRMPAGIMIEAGQADLLLISWLGIDLFNKGERVYRLLGCELTYHGDAPRPGDTLRYAIHVDGHANQGDVRLFFFHYDCRIDGEPRLTVRGGQAGFFSEQELAETGGVLWDATTEPPPTKQPRIDSPRLEPTREHFSREEVDAFSEGTGARLLRPRLRAGGDAPLHTAHRARPYAADGRGRSHRSRRWTMGSRLPPVGASRSAQTTGSSRVTSRTTRVCQAL